MKKILTLIAIIEGATGLALVSIPNFAILFLLGTTLNEPSGIVVCRIAGASLITLALICWLYRNHEDGSGILKGLLFYNTAAAVLLGVAAVNGTAGVGIWPASLLHTGLAAWCLKCLLKQEY